MDYASGQIYVWDARQGLARLSNGKDQEPRMPTLTPVEVAQWRLTFVNEHRAELDGVDLVNAQRWQEQGLSTSYLPGSLQQLWNRDLTLRVRQRLHDFFSQLNPGVSNSAETLSGPSSTDPAKDLLRMNCKPRETEVMGSSLANYWHNVSL